MLRTIALLTVSILMTATMPALADDSTDVDRPNAVSVEILGRGLLYSFDYDRMLSENFAIGAGLSSWSVGASSSDGTDYAAASVLIVPIYVDWYFARSGGHSGFLTGGFDIISAKFSSDGFNFSGSGGAITLGAGYEYRADMGFLFRATLYALFGGGSMVWPGFSLGYAF